MKKFSQLFLMLFSGLLVFPLTAQNINKEDTRLLSKPAISKDKIAFIFAEDLWTANKDGSNPRRLTIDEGIETTPVILPLIESFIERGVCYKLSIRRIIS